MRLLHRCLSLGALILASLAQAAPAPANPDAHARKIIAEWQRIVTPQGVNEQLTPLIGGIPQALSVRGRDKANPLLLVIHGGPASPEMPMSWAYQSGWEDYFTVVQWDQRGAGKSYDLNDPARVGPTLSLERIVQDAAEVVRFIQLRYGKPKVFVVGHSWGSLVGLSLARQHPELLYAYIGMGQVINGSDNERASYAQTLKLAKTNASASAELTALAPYPDAKGHVTLAQINTERKWVMALGGLVYGRDSLDYYSRLALLSPEYTRDNVAAIDHGAELSLPRLLPELLAFDFSDVTQFDCPILMFAGRHDTTTPPSVTAAWMARVKAPKKALVWFENSSHMMEIEEPGRVLVHLVNDVLPLAQ